MASLEQRLTDLERQTEPQDLPAVVWLPRNGREPTLEPESGPVRFYDPEEVSNAAA